MAKKYDVRAAQARRRKAAAAQAKKEREIWEKIRKPLLITVAAIAAVALIWWVVVTFIYVPANGVRVIGGSTTGVQDNWIVANLGTTNNPQYFHMADFDAPEGYTEDKDYASSIYSDSNIQTRYFTADDENAVAKSVYVAGVANYTAQAMAERLLSYGYFTDTEGPTTQTIGNYTVVWGYGKMQSTDDEGNYIDNQGTCTLYAYIDGIRDSSVVVTLNSAAGALDQLPTSAQMLTELEKFLPYLTVTK